MFFLIDVEGIKYVINFDYPNSSEDYIHRIGRTGRSDSTGTSYAFFTPGNFRQAKDLVSVLKEANQVSLEFYYCNFVISNINKVDGLVFGMPSLRFIGDALMLVRGRANKLGNMPSVFTRTESESHPQVSQQIYFV